MRHCAASRGGIRLFTPRARKAPRFGGSLGSQNQFHVISRPRVWRAMDAGGFAPLGEDSTPGRHDSRESHHIGARAAPAGNGTKPH